VSSDAVRRRRWPAFAAIALLAAVGCRVPAAAEPTDAPVRRSFDFARPRPEEVRGLRAGASEPPPRLAQFAPAVTSRAERSGRRDGVAEGAGRPSGSSHAMAPITAGDAPPSSLGAARLARQIVTLGITGALAASTDSADGDALRGSLRRSLLGVVSAGTDATGLRTPRPGQSLEMRIDP
jgi:hypothetical protein